MILAIVISLMIGATIGLFTMSLFSARSYDKGFKDGQRMEKYLWTKDSNPF
jgi:uncharacterized protein YneF (UPF0154 family)